MKFQNKTHKTATKNRQTYIYQFAEGQGVVLRPEDFEEGGEVWIKFLHSQDDSEVYFNLKNQKMGGEYVSSLDKEAEFEEAVPTQIASTDAPLPFGDSTNPAVNRMRDIVQGLPEIQQRIYHLVFIDGYTKSETSQIVFGDKKHESSVRYHINKITEAIKNNF